MLPAQSLFRILSLSLKKRSVCMKSICNYHRVQSISTATATVVSLCSANGAWLGLCFPTVTALRSSNTCQPRCQDPAVFYSKYGGNVTDLWHVNVSCTQVEHSTVLPPCARSWAVGGNGGSTQNSSKSLQNNKESEGCIDHALRLQNKCELCSNTGMKHSWKWLKRRNI